MWKKRLQNQKEFEQLLANTSKVILDDRDLQWFASLIVNSILKILIQCLGPTSRKLVMEKALSNVKISQDLPNYILPFKDALTR
jgi:hypothetical protein